MSNLNVNNISDESGVGNNLILAADGTTTIPGGTNRPQIVGYQQGVWTPTIIFAGSNTGLTEENEGIWERVGDMVHLYGKTQITIKGSVSGAFHIESAPYNTYRTINTSSLAAAGSVAYMANAPSITYFPGIIINEEAKLILYKLNGSQLTADNVDNNWSIRFSIIYRTDDTTWAPINGATLTS